MILVKPSFEIEYIHQNILEIIERAGRTCYKSEAKIDSMSAIPFVKKVLERGHESVIEHASMTVRFICDRGVSHEIVRHRLCAFSQESTRYCNYRGGVMFVIPPWTYLQPGEYDSHTLDGVATPQNDFAWVMAMLDAEDRYINLLSNGWSPQQARSVLPNSLKTEIVVTANVREWRHIFKLRTSNAAHPQMREIMVPLCHEINERVPVLFADVFEGE